MIESTPTLTVADHTLVVKAMFDRPLNVIRYLDAQDKAHPTPQEVLDAAAQVTAFDAKTHDVLIRMRDLHPDVEAGKAQLPQKRIDAIDAVIAKISGKPMREVLAILGRERDQDDDLAPGLEFVEQMLRDGADTIYSPDYPPAEFMRGEGPSDDGTSAGIGVGVADAAGALVGIPLGPGGMVVGAGGASASAVVTAALVEWLSHRPTTVDLTAGAESVTRSTSG